MHSLHHKKKKKDPFLLSLPYAQNSTKDCNPPPYLLPKPCCTTFFLTPTCCRGSNVSSWKPDRRKATSNNSAKAVPWQKGGSAYLYSWVSLKLQPLTSGLKHPESQYPVIPQHLQGAKPPWGQHWTAPENTLIQGRKSSSSCNKQNETPAFQKAKLINRREPRGTKLSQAVLHQAAQPDHSFSLPSTRQPSKPRPASPFPSQLTIRPTATFSYSSFP